MTTTARPHHGQYDLDLDWKEPIRILDAQSEPDGATDDRSPWLVRVFAAEVVKARNIRIAPDVGSAMIAKASRFKVLSNTIEVALIAGAVSALLLKSLGWSSVVLGAAIGAVAGFFWGRRT